MAPYESEVRHYAVEADLVFVNAVSGGWDRVGIFGRSGNNWDDGYQGYLWSRTDVWQLEFGHSGSLGSGPFTMDTNVHTYRLEFLDNQIRFLIDGVLMVEVVDNRNIDERRSGVYAQSGAQLEVLSFRVIAL